MEPQGGTYPVRLRLPVDYSTEIGRIITRWALLESRLRDTTHTLVDCGPKIGRLAVLEPRAQDYITMIQDICKVLKITTTFDFKDTRKRIEEIKFYRDAIANGIWLKHEGTKLPVLRVVRGKYQLPGSGKSFKARIDPQSLVIDLPTMKQLRKGIEMMIVRVDRFRREVKAEIDARKQKGSQTQ